MENAPAQAANAVAQGADYVTIEMGGNDACRRRLVSRRLRRPTGPSSRRRSTRSGRGLPKAYIFVASIPNINILHTIFTSPVDLNALTRWSAFNVCQALLANPTSTAAADVQRRADFQAQVIAYNEPSPKSAGLSAEPLQVRRGAAYNTSFTTSDVANVTNRDRSKHVPVQCPADLRPGIPNSTADYFHPSLAGQAKIADSTWASTYSFD